MQEKHPTWTSLKARQAVLLAADVARWDAVGWHYAQALAARAQQHSGQAQALLCVRLEQVLMQLEAQLAATSQQAAQDTIAASRSAPSPLAALLHDMTHPVDGTATDATLSAQVPGAWRKENPRVQAFRKQLGQIRVQKQVSQAIALAPHNAGPINSHMLVLRSLALMRAVSPDYLNRFMTYVDTLQCLDEAGNGKLAAKKSVTAAKADKAAAKH